MALEGIRGILWKHRFELGVWSLALGVWRLEFGPNAHAHACANNTAQR